jgi:hypothetical protein
MSHEVDAPLLNMPVIDREVRGLLTPSPRFIQIDVER